MKDRILALALRIFRTWRLWIEPERVKMKRDVGSWLSSSPRGTVVVEVGAGIEFMKPVLERAIPDVRYFGGDIAPTTNTRAVFDVRAIPLPSATADVVLALEVLEHIPMPEEAIAEMSRILRPGGSLVLTVPFMFGVHDLMDYYRFTPLGLEEMLTRNGLSINETRRRGGTFVASTGLVRNLILNTIVGKPRDWRAQGGTKKLRWILATVVLTPWTPITWTAYALDAVLDRESVSPPGFFFLIHRDAIPTAQPGLDDRPEVASGATDWYRAILRCPDDHAELLDSSNRRGDPELACTSCGRRFPVEGGVPILLPKAAPADVPDPMSRS
jgi:uncharacterized protein YbaR (Trm112 family)/SAM-dependent methyltransferase